MNIAIIGARGCVGSALIEKLLTTTDHRIIASYRNEEGIGTEHERIVWRLIDLYADKETEKFLEGADQVVYLVHSLDDKKFAALDREFADRVGKMASRMGVRQIIYLGGIIPKKERLSAHLRSRQETGKRLGAHGIPLAEVRASILLGMCSVSYRMVYWLSKKFPVIVMPRWSTTKCSPIALDDAVAMLMALIKRKINGHEIFEMGSETMGYDELILRSGAIIHGKRNRLIRMRWFPLPLMAYFVEMASGVPRHIAEALMGSLKNDSMIEQNRFFEIVGRNPRPVDETLKELAQKMADGGYKKFAHHG